MFCKKCGAELPENTKFCTSCGAPVNSQPETNDNPVEDVPVQDAPVQDAPNESSSYQSNPGTETVSGEYSNPTPADDIPPIREKKKMSKGVKLLLAIGIPVLVIVIAAILCFTVFANCFLSPKALLKKAEKNGGLDDIVEAIALNGDAINNGESGSIDFSIKLSDSASSLLSSFGDIDLSWFENLGFNFEYAASKDGTEATGKLKFNGSDIFSLAEVYDAVNNEMYITVPELNEKALKIDISDIFAEQKELTEDYDSALTDEIIDIDDSEAEEVFKALNNITRALPDKATVKKILNKYLDLIFDSLEPEKETRNVTANGVTEKMTVLTVKLSEKEATDILCKVISELRNDTDVKDIIAKLEKSTGEEYYDDFCDSLDEAVEELKNEYYSDDDLLTYTSYVSGSKTVGRSIETEDFSFSWILATKKDKFGLEATVNGSTLLLGEGTVNKDAYTGDCVVYNFESDDEEEILKLEYEDLLCKDNNLSGKINISFLGGTSEDETSAILALLKFKLEFSENKMELVLNALGTDVVTITGELKKDAKIKAPSLEAPTDAVSVTDDEAMEEWAAEIDPQVIINALTDAGIPEDFISSLFAEDDYDYDYEDYDDEDYEEYQVNDIAGLVGFWKSEIDGEKVILELDSTGFGYYYVFSDEYEGYEAVALYLDWDYDSENSLWLAINGEANIVPFSKDADVLTIDGDKYTEATITDVPDFDRIYFYYDYEDDYDYDFDDFFEETTNTKSAA